MFTPEPQSDSLMTTLKNQGQIWSGNDWRLTHSAASPSGYVALDNLLNGGGWPLGAVTEILCSQPGQGELRLVIPFLEQLGQQDLRWQLWLNPPYQPYGPGLNAWGLNTDKMLICQADKPEDLLWSIEQGITTGGASVVLAWVEALDKAQLRRIQLASEKNGIATFLFRSLKFRHAQSVSALRLAINMMEQQRVQLDILKRRGGWPVRNIDLTLPLQANREVGYE